MQLWVNYVHVNEDEVPGDEVVEEDEALGAEWAEYEIDEDKIIEDEPAKNGVVENEVSKHGDDEYEDAASNTTKTWCCIWLQQNLNYTS